MRLIASQGADGSVTSLQAGETELHRKGFRKFCQWANKQRKGDVSHERQHARFTIFYKFPNPLVANPVSAGVRKAERDGWPRCSARDDGVIHALSILIRS